MKSIIISIKPQWCADIMNGDKTIEVRKNKALAKAIQKLIDENGFADIYVYCSKINKKHHHLMGITDSYTGITEYEIDYYCSSGDYLDYCYDCKVAFKFRCYKVEEIIDYGDCYLVHEHLAYTNKIARQSCLDFVDLKNYLKGKNGYAIHISDLKIFDRPKELKEFWTIGKHCKHKNKPDKDMYCDFCYHINCVGNNLTKAPQNFCYAETK